MRGSALAYFCIAGLFLTAIFLMYIVYVNSRQCSCDKFIQSQTELYNAIEEEVDSTFVLVKQMKASQDSMRRELKFQHNFFYPVK